MAETLATTPPILPRFGLPIGPLASPEVLADPYPLYHALRKASPVLRAPLPAEAGGELWILTRYADIEGVLHDARFSVERERAALVRANPTLIPRALLGESGAFRSMLIMDPPDHTRVRGLVSRAFTPRRAAALAPRIEALVDELLDGVSGSEEWDVMGALAAPLPAIVIAELLGVPARDHRQFKEWSSQLVSGLGAGSPEEARARFEGALGSLLDYLGGIVAERRREPRDDLITALIQARDERDALRENELLATANLLLVAGHETTTNLIGNGLLALLRHPGELARLHAEPGLLRGAIEELLRFDSPVQATVRIAREPAELGGQSIAEGALVFLSLGAANRDPEVFADPDRLDVGRSDVHHLSFGHGPHFCLGANLARLEAEIAFRRLLARFPRLALATDKVEWRPNPVLRGLVALPVRG